MAQTQSTAPTETCAACPYFDNFHERGGRGWCKLFDLQAREHHEMTNDCRQNAARLEEQEAITEQAEIEAAEQEMSKIICEAAQEEIEEAIGLFEPLADSWLTEPIGVSPEAIFGAAAEPEINSTPPQPTVRTFGEASVEPLTLTTEARKLKSVQLASESGWQTSAEGNLFKEEAWEVLTDKDVLYRIKGIRNSYGGVSFYCSCEAGKHSKQCYHVKAIKESEKKRVQIENEKIKRGAIALPDGTVQIDEQFYRTMGDVRQNRGNRSRF
jgi:hypothetical protein